MANKPQRIQKEGNAGRLTLLCIGCTSVVQCEWTVVLRRSAEMEMRNFSPAECGKATRGNLRNVLHLTFRKLPLDNFPHSNIRILQITRAPSGYANSRTAQLNLNSTELRTQACVWHGVQTLWTGETSEPRHSAIGGTLGNASAYRPYMPIQHIGDRSVRESSWL